MNWKLWAPVGGILAAMAAPFLYAEARIRLSETLDAVLDAPNGSHRLVDGLQIHYECMGTGEPVVLIHGFGGSTYSWRENVHAVAAAGFRAYAIDLPGFGYSQRTSRPLFTPSAWARVVADFLSDVEADGSEPLAADEPTGPARVVLVGNSLGASVALRFAVDYPARTKGLILTAPAVYSRRFWGRSLRILDVPVAGRILARSLYYYVLANDRGVARILSAAYGHRLDQVTDEMRAAMVRPIRVRGSAEAAFGLFRSREERPLSSLLSSIAVPILIVAGADDRAVPLANVERLHGVLKTSELVVFSESGHLVQEDEPDKFNRLAVAFMSGLGATRPVSLHPQSSD